jgi:ectoine hydroxylase-related dioxygenase (phytanoyl-CoA dioxygenase family)
MLTPTQLAELEAQSYTVIPNYLTAERCARYRAFMDSLFPARVPREDAQAKRLHTARHPIAGDPAILAETIADRRAWAIGEQTLRSKNLFVLEQVLIRTDPGPKDKRGANGWHMDMTFVPGDYQGTPRRTYFHMVHCLSSVKPGGGAFTIIPRSHHLTLACLAGCQTDDELDAAKGWGPERFGVKLSDAKEVCANEGDLLIFNPLAYHSASPNIQDDPRYVLFLSFCEGGARRLLAHLQKVNYKRNFSPELKAALPPDLAARLDLPTPAGG